MVFKKILTMFFSAIVLSTSLTTIINAETMHPPDYDVAAPTYEIADDAISILSINGQTAECNSRANSRNAVKIYVVQTLEKYSGWFWIWNAVDGASWKKVTYSSSIKTSSTISGLSSGTYRLKSEFTLTNSAGKTETITAYSDEVKVA